jgi:hypothetical protein
MIPKLSLAQRRQARQALLALSGDKDKRYGVDVASPLDAAAGASAQRTGGASVMTKSSARRAGQRREAPLLPSA